ncbi:MAG: type II toxin-antitoxin system VapC family toxin [Verrucomicrobia bacterium]|nr:type II toxin-antitoxin system VapC family toxin [Verrucomicrobiota bacterium]
MNPNRFVLDTNIVSAFFKKETVIGDAILHAERVYLPITVLGELHFGAEKSQEPEKQIQRITRFLPLVEVIHITQGTAETYGRIKAVLETRGQAIPDNDLWIAATALEYGLPLVSRDQHFHRVPGLSVLPW